MLQRWGDLLRVECSPPERNPGVPMEASLIMEAWLIVGDCCVLWCRGIVLKDLVAIDAQGKDYLSSSDNLNLSKYRLLWTTLSYIRSAQSKAPSLTVDTYYMRVLRVRRE